MYLLKFVQYDREIEVGLFEAEEEIFEFLGKIPYYSKTVDIIDEEQYDSHSLKLEEIPEYDEIVYNNYRFILTKFMFNEDDRIDVDWVRLQNFSVKSDSQEPVYSEGSTRVDAYIAVSYTHLDVYKRQEYNYREREDEKIFSFVRF